MGISGSSDIEIAFTWMLTLLSCARLLLLSTLLPPLHLIPGIGFRIRGVNPRIGRRVDE